MTIGKYLQPIFLKFMYLRAHTNRFQTRTQAGEKTENQVYVNNHESSYDGHSNPNNPNDHESSYDGQSSRSQQSQQPF